MAAGNNRKSKGNKQLQPFKELAFGLMDNNDVMFDEQPIGIQEFIESEQFLNLKFDGRRGCRPKIMEIAKELSNPKVREAILILGKGSIPYESLITLSDGRQVSIGSLYEKFCKDEEPISLVNHSLATNRSHISLGIPKYSGKKKIYNVRLSDGTEFQTSMNHKMVTYNGYQKLEKLDVGSEIAVFKDLTIIKGNKTCTLKEARFLGYMIADGFLGGHDYEDESKQDRRSRYSFTTSYEWTKKDFLKCLKSIDPDCEPYVVVEKMPEGYRDKYHICFWGDDRTIHKKSVATNADKLIRSTGLYGKRSGSKFVPEIIKAGTKKIIGNFVSAYWTCDGEVNNGRKNPNCSYYYVVSSKSRQLLVDVQYLLRRIGVYTYLKTGTKFIKCIGRDYTASGLGFCGNYESVLNFYKYIKLRGYKGRNQKRSLIVNNKTGRGTSTKLSSSPNQVNLKAQDRIIKAGGSTRKFGSIKPSIRKCFSAKRISNKTLNEIEETYGGNRDFVNGAISYEEIVSIDLVGEMDAYDITILCGKNKRYRNYCVSGSVLIGNSGKDFLSSIMHLYGIYRSLCMHSPQSYYGLAPNSPIYYVNVARNENQAKNVFFKEFVGHLMNCPWFASKYRDPGTMQVTFDKNVVALSGNSQAFAWLGYNVVQWVGDELAFFLENQSDANTEEDTGNLSRAEECWEAAYGSCQTRFPDHYKMIGITTPRFDDDFVMKKFAELKRRMIEKGDAYAVKAATWEVHPRLKKEDFASAFQKNFRRTMRDFGAEPMGVIDTFWGDPDFIDNNPCENCKECPIYQNKTVTDYDLYECYDHPGCTANGYCGNGEFRDWFKPDSTADYYAHVDLSTKKDRTSITIGHASGSIKVEIDPYKKIEQAQEEAGVGIGRRGKHSVVEITDEDLYEERPIITLDAIIVISPASNRDNRLVRNNEIYYEGILKYIFKNLLGKGFNLVKVTFDQFQSHMLRQSLEDLGIEVDLLSLDRTDEVPVQAKNAFVEGRVIYCWNRIFAKEARHLQYRGKKVDHPTGKGKDIIDSAFGAVFNVETTFNGSSFYELIEIEQD